MPERSLFDHNITEELIEENERLEAENARAAQDERARIRREQAGVRQWLLDLADSLDVDTRFDHLVIGLRQQADRLEEATSDE